MKLHRLLRFVACLIVVIIASFRESFAQYDPYFVVLSAPSAALQSTTHTGTGTIDVPCSGNGGPNLKVDYELTFSLTKDLSQTPPYYSLGTWLKFTNNNNVPVSFVVCGMVNFQRPNNNTYINDNNNPELPANVLSMTRDNTTNPCTYRCNSSSPEVHDYWAYHFGCTEMHLNANESDWAFDGERPITPVAYPYGDNLQTPIPIELSSDSYVQANHTRTTWNYNNYYIDLLGDCNIDPTCDAAAEQPNGDIDPSDNMLPCAANIWAAQTVSIIKKGGGPNQTATIAFDVGNWVTMSRMGVYPARFVGTFSNAPAGTTLLAYYPVDTASGNVVIDSAQAFVGGSAGCAGDTLGFAFPFMIPSMGGHMNFIVKLPNDSCKDIGNGRRFELHGEVFAGSTTSVYDSGHFMYGTNATFLLDTTSPTVTNYALTQIDSTHLVVAMTGSEDTSMLTDAYLRYSVNGGSTHIYMLRYENNLDVGHTTNFLDTLVLPRGAQIIARGFVRNELGLLDSTAIDTCTLAPLFNTVRPEDRIRDFIRTFLYNRATKSLLLDLHCTAGLLSIDLSDMNGRVIPLMPPHTTSEGEQILTVPLPLLAEGTYFAIIRTPTGNITQKLIY